MFFNIKKIETTKPHEIVDTVHWTALKKEAFVASYETGTAKLGSISPDDEHFVPIENVDLELLHEWVEKVIDVKAIEARLDAKNAEKLVSLENVSAVNTQVSG